MYNSLGMALVVSFAVAAFVGLFLVPWLRRMKAGQSIREDGPTWHMSKSGTPTMGGLMFIVGTAVACVTAGFDLMLEGEYGHIFAFIFASIFGAIGFLDDYEKLRKKRNLGLSAPRKFLLQLVVAIVFVLLLRYFGYLRSSLYIPFLNRTIMIPDTIYLVFSAFVIVGTVNAVNLTDGVDGLAAGTTIPVALCFMFVSAYWGEKFASAGIYAAALTGGLAGFLLFNFNPAKVFMGDTGSLFLGGAVCAMAFITDMPLILVPLGLLYILEVISDIIQVTYFKLTRGKRFFKMAPFHHHLEMGGWSGKKWSEKELFTLFTSISSVCAAASFFAVRGRFGG